MGIRTETITVKSYQRGGKAISIQNEDTPIAIVPMGISSNGFPVRIADNKIFAYVVTEKGLPLKEASDGENIGDVGVFVL